MFNRRNVGKNSNEDNTSRTQSNGQMIEWLNEWINRNGGRRIKINRVRTYTSMYICLSVRLCAYAYVCLSMYMFVCAQTSTSVKTRDQSMSHAQWQYSSTVHRKATVERISVHRTQVLSKQDYSFSFVCRSPAIDKDEILVYSHFLLCVFDPTSVCCMRAYMHTIIWTAVHWCANACFDTIFLNNLRNN